MQQFIKDVLAYNRPNTRAQKLFSPGGYEFKSYGYGVGRNVRLCVELDAVLGQPRHPITTYGGKVGDVALTKRYRYERTALAAIEDEARRQGIIPAKGGARVTQA